MPLFIQSPKLYRGLILSAISLFLIHLKVSGDLNFLVSPIMTTFIEIAILPLCVISLITLVSALIKFMPHKKVELKQTRDAHIQEDGHTHLDHTSFWYRLTMGLMVLFLVLSFTWRPSSLGTSMISGQTGSVGLNPSNLAQTSSNSNSRSSGPVISKDGKQYTQASIAFKYNENPKGFIGKSFTLIGFVYHPPSLPKNQFILTRFYIFCCVADAIPIGVAVESPNASQFKSDSWVQLTGTLQTEHLPAFAQFEPTKSWVPKDKNQPILIADSIKAISVPKQPYMVP